NALNQSRMPMATTPMRIRYMIVQRIMISPQPLPERASARRPSGPVRTRRTPCFQATAQSACEPALSEPQTEHAVEQQHQHGLHAERHQRRPDQYRPERMADVQRSEIPARPDAHHVADQGQPGQYGNGTKDQSTLQVEHAKAPLQRA